MKSLINIWMQPVYARLNMDSRRSLLLLLALFPLGGELFSALIYFGSKNADAKLSIFFYGFLLSLAAALVIVLMAWFLLLVMNIGVQYSPANAAIVPGLKRQLQLSLALPMVSVATLSVVIASLAAHKFTIFPAFLCILFFSYFIGLMRSQWLVIPAVLSGQVPQLLERQNLLSSGAFDPLKQGMQFEFVLFVVSALMLWGMLHWFFSLRDEAHFKMHKRSLALRQGMNSREIPINQFAARFNSPFLTWMQMCIRRGQTSMKTNAKLDLSPFATGPRLHWTTIMVQLFLMIAVGVAMIIAIEVISGPKSKAFMSGFSIGFPAMILIGLPLVFCSYSFYTLYQTRTEQALFNLTPVVSDSRAMDKALTHYMLRQFAVLMGMSLVFALVLLRYGKDFERIAEFLSLGWSCMFVFVLGMGHPYSQMKAVTDHPLFKIGFIAVVLLVAGIVMTIFIANQIAWWLSAAIVIVTSATLVFRLKRNAQTVQFPVGRAVS